MVDRAFSNFKVVFIGDTQVGKTSIIRRALTNTFDENGKSTVGCTYVTITTKVEDDIVQLSICDTAGQERFDSLAPIYIRGAVVVVLVYSQDSIESFNHIDNWMEKVIEIFQNNLPSLFLVENKIDLDEHLFPLEEATDKARNYGMQFHSVSAKSGDNIAEFIKAIAETAYHRPTYQESHIPDPIPIEQDEQEAKTGCC